MQESHIGRLYDARLIADIPFVINSGHRCIAHNRTVGGSHNSDHLSGHGTDIRCTDSAQRWIIIDALLHAGFRRIGIAKTFIHAGSDPRLPQEVVWTY